MVCPIAELTGIMKSACAKVASNPIIALVVTPNHKSGSGRPLRTRNTTMMAMKKQRLPDPTENLDLP